MHSIRRVGRLAFSGAMTHGMCLDVAREAADYRRLRIGECSVGGEIGMHLPMLYQPGEDVLHAR